MIRTAWKKFAVCLLCLSLTSCFALGRNGFFIPKEKEHRETKYNGTPLVTLQIDSRNEYINIPFFENGPNTHKYLNFYFSQSVSQNIYLAFIIIFPVPLPFIVSNSASDNYEYLTVSFLDKGLYPADFFKELKMYITVDGKKYPAVWLRNPKEVRVEKGTADYAFKVRVKNILKTNNILFIEYKGDKEEIPFVYKKLWKY